MKRFVVAAIAAAALAFPAIAALKPGEKAPAFAAKASLAGKAFDFSLARALKKGPVVVYFYPAAFTGGCNVQARSFAERHPQFAAAHATIIGVSGDSIARLNAFSADPQYCAGKFPVASDPEGAIGTSYGLQVKVREGAPTFKDSRGVLLDNKVGIERTTFVIGKDGRVVARFSSAEDKIKAGDHAVKALEVVQRLAKHGR